MLAAVPFLLSWHQGPISPSAVHSFCRKLRQNESHQSRSFGGCGIEITALFCWFYGKLLKCTAAHVPNASKQANIISFLLSLLPQISAWTYGRWSCRYFRVFFFLTLASTCYFPILERTSGGGVCNPPCHFELWDKDQTNSWDVLSPMVSELTYLGHILTSPGRVKVKKIGIWGLTVFRKKNFELRKIAK